MKQIIFILFLIILSGIAVEACSASPDDPARDFRQARAVFIGKVIDITVDEQPLTGTHRYDILYKIRFNVEKSWKGGKPEIITVISDNGKSDCGRFNFLKGEKYLVYANTYGERLAAWATGGSPTQILKPENLAAKHRINDLNNPRFRKRADSERFRDYFN